MAKKKLSEFIKQKRSDKMHKRMEKLAIKYYGTSNLAQLAPHQLDKITNWVTNTNPNTQAHIKGNKYSGNTYGKIKQIF